MYSVRQTLYKKLSLCEVAGGFVYNVAVVRQLCADISAETDPAKAAALADLLHAVLREDQEEIRFRMAYLARKYASVIDETKAAD